MSAEIFDLRAVFECKRALHEFKKAQDSEPEIEPENDEPPPEAA